MVRVLAAATSLTLAQAAHADDLPDIQHQPVPCTVPAKPFAVCATVTDDGRVAKARVYFRDSRKKYFSYVDMVFGGMQFCATLPAPRSGKLKAMDYYVHALDDQYQAQRTSTHQIQIQDETLCSFPPVAKDARRSVSIVVYATDPDQGSKLGDAFEDSGVSFVAVKKAK